MKERQNRLFGILALLLAVAQVVAVIGSWLVAAAMPQAAMRSLLSAEGIRWFFGHFTQSLATPLLVWLVLGLIACGTLRASGLLALRRPLGFRERFALRVVAAEGAVVVVIMLLLTMLPQAILLSATGGLMHSSFVHSLVPVACFTFTAMSVTYGVTVGRLHGLADIFGAMVSGFNKAGVFFVFYILIAGLYRSVVFVFIF